MKPQLYNILGINPKDKKATIKKAYRNKSKIHHPDKGGNSKEFGLISKAYQILMDDDKRERYDKGEDVDSMLKAKNDNDESINIIANFLIKVLKETCPINNDIIKLVKINIEKAISKTDECIKNQNNLKDKFDICISKLKHKRKNKKDIVVHILNGRIDEILKNIEDFEKSKAQFEKAYTIMKDYDYDFIEEMIITDIGDLSSAFSRFTC